jgi:hypothetical protein
MHTIILEAYTTTTLEGKVIYIKFIHQVNLQNVDTCNFLTIQTFPNLRKHSVPQTLKPDFDIC